MKVKTLKMIPFKILVALVLVIVLFPIFWMVAASFKAPLEFTTKPIYALPDGFYLKNYVDAWTIGNMSVFYKNSIIITASALVFVVVFAAMISFGLVKLRWKGSGLCMLMFSMGIVIPVQMVLIPLFTIYNKTGIINTKFCLVLTYIGFHMSLAIYLFAGYIRSVPDEILEAAVMDGCSVYTMFLKVIVPMMKSAAATVLVVSFFAIWNDLIFSMTFVSSTAHKTLQTGLLYFQNEFGNKEWGPIFAAITMVIVPTIAVYIVLNKKVIKGMTEGAVKG